jgi:hypothetical protein
MGRRKRKGLFAILFPELHKAVRRAAHDMRPDRAIGRMMSVPELKSGVRPLVGTRTTHVTGETRKKQVTGVQRKQTAAANKATRKIQPRGTGKAVVTKRNKRGQFDSVKAMSPHELAAYERAVAKGETPPPAVRWAGTRRAG